MTLAKQHLSFPEIPQTARYAHSSSLARLKALQERRPKPQITSSLDDACTDLNGTEKDVDCQSFLDAHGDELVPQVKTLGDDEACLAIEVCASQELADVHNGDL